MGPYRNPNEKYPFLSKVPFCKPEKAQNIAYRRFFKRYYFGLLRQKAQQFPKEIDLGKLKNVKSLRDFTEEFTAPIHGFRDAQHYWETVSCGKTLGDIRIPTLLVNAKDDPFLGPSSYPENIAKNNPFFLLETPRHGGHVGFIEKTGDGFYWSDKRLMSILDVKKD